MDFQVNTMYVCASIIILLMEHWYIDRHSHAVVKQFLKSSTALKISFDNKLFKINGLTKAVLSMLFCQ